MGVVFGLFAGYYYWSPKITGYMYNEILGRIQFWSLFIGVNLTFFPMHFLGLAGMPRRIGDYPDSYGPWNYVATLGSMISFMTLLLFMYIIYDQLSSKKNFKLWNKKLYFFKDNIYTINTLEWLLDNPPKFHNYNEIPIS